MMKQFAIGLLIACLVGCSGSDGDLTDAAESPQQLARENAQLADEALRESDRGVDDSGERVWKQEARAFFDFSRFPSNRTFELPPEWAREFVETAYAAGAPNVWVPSITEFELGGARFHISDHMVVELPSDDASRQQILGAYNTTLERSGQTPLADIGQSYLFVTSD